MSFETDKSWTDERQDEVCAIVKKHLDRIISVRVASPDEDTKQATDLVIEVVSGSIAARVRRHTDFRDWTIRSHRRSGVTTELQKLRAGFARWYLYAWTVATGNIKDYVLIDLDRVRAIGLLDEAWIEQSADCGNTHFISVSVTELRKEKCLVVDNCKTPCKQTKVNCRPLKMAKVCLQQQELFGDNQ